MLYSLSKTFHILLMMVAMTMTTMMMTTTMTTMTCNCVSTEVWHQTALFLSPSPPHGHKWLPLLPDNNIKWRSMHLGGQESPSKFLSSDGTRPSSTYPAPRPFVSMLLCAGLIHLACILMQPFHQLLSFTLARHFSGSSLYIVEGMLRGQGVVEKQGGLK